MAWVMNSSLLIHNTFSSLGTQQGDTYIISDDCINILNDILKNLILEDRFLRTYRRAIGLCQNVKNDLMPLLIHAQTCKTEAASKIVDTTLKILVNLTIPVECLLPIEKVSESDAGKHTIFELNRLLITSKEVFSDNRSTKVVVDLIKDAVEEKELDISQCESINNCLLLIRNVLHIPENKVPLLDGVQSQMQNQIIWNFFAQSFGKIILNLLSCPEKAHWNTTLVQLLALLYKDQHAGNLKKLISLWFEASQSDSSEDNESNTSPPNQGSFVSSPNMMSDPTSDSSDNGLKNSDKNCTNSDNWSDDNKIKKSNSSSSNSGCSIKNENSEEKYKQLGDVNIFQTYENRENGDVSKINSWSASDNTSDSKSYGCENGDQNNLHFKHRKMSELTDDYGYVTQPDENRGESISTSSNEEDQPLQKPVHQKPPNFHKTRYNNAKSRAVSILENKENRKKKLVKRGKMNMINLKGLIRYTATDEDITNILKEFTVSFLMKGYSVLVFNLHSQMLNNYHLQIDTSHFFWLLTYFLKFATELELEWEMFKPVLSFQIISYLVFQGVSIYEEFESLRKNSNSKTGSCIKRLHLTITAIKEFLQAVDVLSKAIYLNESDHQDLEKLKSQIVKMEELKKLFVFLLYQYDRNVQSKAYLQDLIETNHLYLLFYDKVSREENCSTNILEHLQLFSSSEIMHQYGILLENFQENGEFVNNCIFTMMHHVAGDLENVSSLFQPHILKTFSLIWETDFDVCDEWSDLIEYMINKFINSSKESENSECAPVEQATPIVAEDDLEDLSILAVSPTPSVKNGWTEEEKTNLQMYFVEGCNGQDTVENIRKKYEEVGISNKTQKEIVQQLIKQKLINQDQVNYVSKTDEEKIEGEEPIFEENIQESSQNQINEIQILKEYLAKNNKGKFILWLQEVLVEACYIKLLLRYPEEFIDSKHVPEPVEYYYASLNLSIPLIPWTTEQSNILKHQPFVLLLHKLGFHIPAEMEKVFIRIPNFWSPDYILSTAQQLAPLNPVKLKFDISQVLSRTPLGESVQLSQNNYPIIPSPNHSLRVMRSQLEIPELDCIIDEKLDSSMPMDVTIKEESLYDTLSVTSDLTRMYVSDEEDKIEELCDK